MNHRANQSISRELKLQFTVLGSFIALFWILEILDQSILSGSLDRFGIVPHNFIGLRGILFAPFLHGGFGHLIANTLPFLVLGWFVMLQKTSDFLVVTLITMIVGGLGVWIFGAPGSVHIGASILIFGYLGFLLSRGFFQGNLPSIMLSIIVFFMYGGLIWGIVPSFGSQISWQGHLFGFIGGILAARWIGSKSSNSY